MAAGDSGPLRVDLEVELLPRRVHAYAFFAHEVRLTTMRTCAGDISVLGSRWSLSPPYFCYSPRASLLLDQARCKGDAIRREFSGRQHESQRNKNAALSLSRRCVLVPSFNATDLVGRRDRPVWVIITHHLSGWS